MLEGVYCFVTGVLESLPACVGKTLQPGASLGKT